MSVVVGVDVGGSKTTAVAFDYAGSVVRTAEAATGAGGRHVVTSTTAVIRSLRIGDIDAIGVGVPGQVDPVAGHVRLAVNLGMGGEPYPLAREVQSALGCPVIIENDVRAAALGLFEQLRRQAQEPASLALVSIGTGIAAGVVVDGAIVRGWHGMAGEIGHVVVDPDGPRCRCGQRGCLEAIAAGPALARAWPRAAGAAGAALFAAAAGGDPAAGKVAARIAGHLVTALTWLAATHDTERIVLGGGVAEAGENFLEAVRAEIIRRARTSELAARRLRPEQVTLIDPTDIPGPRGASVLAMRFLQLRAASARATASNDK